MSGKPVHEVESCTPREKMCGSLSGSLRLLVFRCFELARVSLRNAKEILVASRGDVHDQVRSKGCRSEVEMITEKLHSEDSNIHSSPRHQRVVPWDKPLNF
jgi:hypothetical protein